MKIPSLLVIPIMRVHHFIHISTKLYSSFSYIYALFSYPIAKNKIDIATNTIDKGSALAAMYSAIYSLNIHIFITYKVINAKHTPKHHLQIYAIFFIVTPSPFINLILS